MKKEYGLIDMCHPTQVTVGYAEVGVKMIELMGYEHEGTLEKYLKSKTIPGILGPDNRIYITDHHHMGLALTILATNWDIEHKNDKKENPYRGCYFDIEYDFSKSNLEMKDFFKVLQTLEFMHPFDEHGLLVDKKNIPRRLIDLKDDPYRSLAGFVRKSGGFEKINKAYLEFQWADFFRDKITKEEINTDIKEAVIKGVAVALSDNAKDLPGWKGIEILKKFDKQVIKQIEATKNKLSNESGSFVLENVNNARDSITNTKALKFKSKD